LKEGRCYHTDPHYYLYGSASTAGDRCAQQENILSHVTILNLDILQSFLKHLFCIALSKAVFKKNTNHMEEGLKNIVTLLFLGY